MMHNKYKFIVVLFFCGIITLLTLTKSMYLTYRGNLKQNFTTYDSSILPYVLANYIRDNHNRFVIYKIPNQVRNLLIYNSDFNEIYKSNKHTVLMFTGYNKNLRNSLSIERFYNHLSSIKPKYTKRINFVVRSEDKDIQYKLSDDTQAYKELKEHCAQFCVIDRELKSMFVLKNISDSELELAEVILQQYSQNSSLNY